MWAMVWLPDLDLGTAYRAFLKARYHLGLTKIKEMPGPTQSCTTWFACYLDFLQAIQKWKADSEELKRLEPSFWLMKQIGKNSTWRWTREFWMEDISDTWSSNWWNDDHDGGRAKNTWNLGQHVFVMQILHGFTFQEIQILHPWAPGLPRHSTALQLRLQQISRACHSARNGEPRQSGSWMYLGMSGSIPPLVMAILQGKWWLTIQWAFP